MRRQFLCSLHTYFLYLFFRIPKAGLFRSQSGKIAHTGSSLRRITLASLSIVLLAGTVEARSSYPLKFTDASGAKIVLSNRPERVVSLVPGITEIIFELEAGDAVQGVTWHETFPAEATRKEIVGGFFSPSLERIETLDPDVIFLSSLHKDVRDRFAGRPCKLIQLDSRSIATVYGNIKLLGAIFDRQEQASGLVHKIQDELQLVSRKVEKTPLQDRKRVIRLMGRDKVMTPGDDSFQNELIRAAGGIPPQLGKNGAVVEVSLEEWQRFNPQVIYGCGGDRETAENFFSLPGWKDVDAVRNGAIHYFPCELTCRASAHTGYFVGWLASTIYEEEFSKPGNRLLEEKRVASKPVALPLDYVKYARVDETPLFDFPNKTLIVEFKEPLRVVSTLEGERTGVTTIGNHGSPPMCWGVTHRIGFEGSKRRTFKALGKQEKQCSLLQTGANMENLSVKSARYKDMEVYALVTAGVQGNAVRMAYDEGRFYEPGTINIILMANMHLSPRAMTRAIISATEAKTAALQDLDIRSTANPQYWQATGTGTDEMIVIEGRGVRLDSAGGHCKLGELIARAVYDGVKEAVSRQNSITTKRSIFRRLQERGAGPDNLMKVCSCMEQGSGMSSDLALKRLEEVLMQPRYAAFIESALALSDAYERGLISNLDAFESWGRSIADDIACGPSPEWKELIVSKEIPVVLGMSINALLNGISRRPI
jgi:ABC-type Fe3+-hydroxamate transport system substrate-binding protein/adenosylcobinamide amidohydrolase